MAASTVDIIKLQRSNREKSSPEVQGEQLLYGEPFYLDTPAGDQYLAIGDHLNNSTVTTLNLFKAFPQDIVDNQVFYINSKMVGSKQLVYLQDEDKNRLYLHILGDEVYWTNDEGDATTVKSHIEALETWKNNLKYAGSQTAGGPADSANKINTSTGIGSETQPVYVDQEGTIKPCTPYNQTTVQTSVQTQNVFLSEKKDTVLYLAGAEYNDTTSTARPMFTNSSIYIANNNVLMGAAWNDFAETRRCNEEAGTCVREVGDGSLVKTTKRLQPGASVVSDTFGMLIGPHGDDYKAIAIAGRVLVKTDKDKETFTPGAAVCSGEDGTVSMMSREEIKEYPDMIVGYVSEIPTYEEWNGVKVENRIWIKVR